MKLVAKFKVKLLQVLLKKNNRRYIVTFANIGVTLEDFLPANKVRNKSIPVCLDSLKLHALHDTYLLFAWKNSLIAKPEIPSSLDRG